MVWKELGQDPVPPSRKANDKGTRGRNIALITNHFPVTIKNKKLVIYRYDVTMKDYKNSEDFPKTLKQAVFEEMKVCFPKVFEKAQIAFDGQKNAYSTTLINQFKKGASKPYNVEVKKESGKSSTYIVQIVNVNKASMADIYSTMKDANLRFKSDRATIFQMVEVMFRHYRAQQYIPVGRNSFFPIGDDFHPRNNIGGGKDGVTGFFATLRPAAWKDGSILLNFDMSHTAFYREQSLLNLMKDTLFIRDQDFAYPLDNRNRIELKDQVKGIKVKTTHTPIKRVYKVNGVTMQGADKLSFEMTDPNGKVKKVTVVQYIKEVYKKTVKYPKLNCLHVGNPNKKIYIPIEYCEIEKGQRVKKKLSDKEVAMFIRSTAVPPAERLKSIITAAQKNNFKTDPMLNTLSFSVEDRPMQIDGRVIDPPELAMSVNFRPRDGVWDSRGKKFQTPATLKHWAVLNYDRIQMQDVQRFVGKLIQYGTELGMQIAQPFDFFQNARDPNPDQDIKYYKEKNPGLELLMCVLGNRHIYPTIKKAGDRDNEIITQCVMAMNVSKCQEQTVKNLLLKINAKLGGTNTALATGNPRIEFMSMREVVMVMGADVNHPPAGSTSMPSLVAVVGSYDRFATKYATEVRAQNHRMEMIEDMTEITMNLLKNFRIKTNKVPTRIVMYRDGVSESQFSEVLGGEMRKMRAACTKLKEGYQPAITFLCVQKRHHTRLFCANEQKDGVGKARNVPPGTVVDTAITHPMERDFYLCSHAGIQGTSRPAHYHVLWDDSDFSMDQLQAITYELCHTYSRCNRSVSIPCPAYYAHLAAFRAKVYVTEILNDDSQSSKGSSSNEPTIDINRVRSLTRVALDSKLGSRLYYV